ncbi:4'-phosphopantetheinyl transferase family protein [Rothia nasimurium]|uniref:4'-phosphopantetheinyl transferase family protein n=1 Tax=Rothia nasimurium TaxID=85336 RepID=UPI0009F2E1EE|nr:4'-phosphopantetheinyl transferase superfamily protein [Rothia nasimurium]
MEILKVDSAFIALEHEIHYPIKILSDAEQEVAEKWNTKRRLEFTGGRVCAKTALKYLGSKKYRDILRLPDGSPSWPAKVVGSIAHCQDFYAAIVGCSANFAALGIDVEPNERLPIHIINRIASNDELNSLKLLHEEQSNLAWDRLLFCAKEAAFKAIYQGYGQFLTTADMQVLMKSNSTEFIVRYKYRELTKLVELSREVKGSFKLLHGRLFVFVLICAPSSVEAPLDELC